MKEIWKDIVGYEGYYQVSSFGRVRSVERCIVRKNGSPMRLPSVVFTVQVGKNGYCYVVLSKCGIFEGKTVHRLVACAFLPNYCKKREVNHKDGDKTNNIVSNIEWVTSSENKKHALANGLIKHPTKGKFGVSNPRSRIVVQKDCYGNVVAEHGSMCEAERVSGVFQANISKVCHGERSSAGGYVWSFKK